MSKQQQKSKINNLKDPRKYNPAIPQGNVLDLRKTDLGSKQYSKFEKEQAQLANKIAKAKKKENSFLNRLFAKKEPAPVIKSEPVPAPIKSVSAKIEKPKQKSEKIPKVKTQIFRTSFKPLTVFVSVCLILVLPFACLALYQKLSDIRSSVISLSGEAVEDIKIGSQLAADFNFNEASDEFNNAFTKFSQAEAEIDSFNTAVSSVLEVAPGKGQEYKSAKNLVTAATHLSGAAENVTLAFNIFSQLDSQVLKNVNQENPVSITDIIVLGHASLQPASDEIALAVEAFDDVDPKKLPIEYQDQIAYVKQELPRINNSLKQVLNLSQTMLTILGHDESKRYLVVFQNNREIRATGGFLGSYGLLDIDEGEVANIDISGGGTYDLNGALKAQVVSPEPLHLVNPIWQFQDSNWWPDWPTSAQKMEWFYNQSDGPTVDGVLSLTPEIIEDMLDITGPIEMEEYNVTIDSENFYDIVQNEAERKYNETQESKKIIADLTPILLDRLFSLEKDSALAVLEIFYNSLREKNILLYFNDPLLQEEMKNLGWSGSIKDTSGDYLSVINTNISGGKTDAVIEEIINHKSEVKIDGSIIDTVTITRTHKGHETDFFSNVINWDYVRLYVPEGSQLISADGFKQPDKKLILDPPEDYEIDKDLKNISGDVYIEDNTKMRINNEFNKTVFANWVAVGPGESVTFDISYKLPFKIETEDFFNNVDTYSLLIQKQPGSFNSLFNTQLVLPDKYAIKWRYPNYFEGNFDTVLNTDKYIGVVLAEEE